MRSSEFGVYAGDMRNIATPDLFAQVAEQRSQLSIIRKKARDAKRNDLSFQARPEVACVDDIYINSNTETAGEVPSLEMEGQVIDSLEGVVQEVQEVQEDNEDLGNAPYDLPFLANGLEQSQVHSYLRRFRGSLVAVNEDLPNFIYSGKDRQERPSSYFATLFETTRVRSRIDDIVEAHIYDEEESSDISVFASEFSTLSKNYLESDTFSYALGLLCAEPYTENLKGEFAGQIFEDIARISLKNTLNNSVTLLSPERTFEVYKRIYPQAKEAFYPLEKRTLMGKSVADGLLVEKKKGKYRISSLVEYTLSHSDRMDKKIFGFEKVQRESPHLFTDNPSLTVVIPRTDEDQISPVWRRDFINIVQLSFDHRDFFRTFQHLLPS